MTFTVKAAPLMALTLAAGLILASTASAQDAALIKKGETAGANEQLDILLKQWKDADSEFPLLKEVKALRGNK